MEQQASLSESLKGRMQAFTEALQDRICQALEALDGRARFREDLWLREGGGGGRSRVLEDGGLFEKAGVYVSTVFGELEAAIAARMPGEGRSFYASGISLVLHPWSPMVPTVHANFRYIVHGPKAWFGGGADLTPYYLFDEDARHFHAVLKGACDRHDLGYYPRFKKACDEYFHVKHRGETRGVGGLFFEDMGGDLEKEFSFVQDCAGSFLDAYLPIADRRRDLPGTEQQRLWQEVRRGRYVEFNLVYDRGTLFGLQTRGRIESILMSLPPRVRWIYDFQTAPGSEEARLLEVLRSPRDWV